MHPDESTFFKIEDYLRGRLSPADRAAFEAEMESDAALAELTRRQQLERQALELLAERDLRVRMNTWERRLPPVMVATTSSYRLGWVKWAAAAALVLGLGWWLIQYVQQPAEAPIAVRPENPLTRPDTQARTKTPSNRLPAPKSQPSSRQPEIRPSSRPPKEVIVEAPQKNIPQPIPRPAPTPPPVKETIDYAALADAFYQERDFMPVKKNTGNGALVLKETLAHSLLKSRKYDAAVIAFQEIARSGKQPYADRADWGLALVYLHQMPRRKGALDQLLGKIAAKPGHAFYGKAKALQGRLAGK